MSLASARNTLIGSAVAIVFILALALFKGQFTHPTTLGRRHLIEGVGLFGLMGLYGGGRLLLEVRRERRIGSGAGHDRKERLPSVDDGRARG